MQREVLKGPAHQTHVCLCSFVKPLCPVPFLVESSSFLHTVNAFAITHTLTYTHTQMAPSLEKYHCIMKDTTKKYMMSVCVCVHVHGRVYGKAEPIIW